MDRTLEQRTMAKVAWRLLPLIVVIYFVAYIDRTNVGFAAISMNRDLGFSAYLYGWGAGIFFLGYALFEVPSNVILHRVGARVWIARIMVTWGIVSGCMAFVSGPVSFLVIRFLLGVAEAGFFPGVLLYFTYWFPSIYRARVISALFLAVPGSNAVAAALSGALLQMDGVWGMAGWKWMFLLESLPAVALAPVVLKLLTDRPSDAGWLEADEREWLVSRMEEERRKVEGAHRHLSLYEALTDRRVVSLSLIYLTIVSATYGITFFLPLMVNLHGLTTMNTGFVTAIPYVIGTIGMVIWAWSSDRMHERRWHFTIACVLAAVGLVAAGVWSRNLYIAMAAMSVAAIGLYGSKPAFWPLPSTFLSGTAAAGGIALVNSIGNLGGFAGPYVVGWIRTSTQSYEMGLFFLAGCALLSAAIALLTVKPVRTERVPETGEAAALSGSTA
jgi:MFS transporter, ACS family, tartrate transporter